MNNLTLDLTAPEAAQRQPRSGLANLASGVLLVVDAIASALSCRSDREIERMIRLNGGVMSDEVERRIQRHLGA